LTEETGIAFEAAISRLEEIAEKLESGEMPLGESLALFEEGIKLARECSKQLTDAQGRIEALVKRADGELCTEPLET